MNWILLVLIVHFFWAIENVYTKIVIGSKIKNPYIFLILLTILSILVLPFIGSQYIVLPPGNTVWWLVLASLFYTFSGFPYIKAMEFEEVTRINILWNAIPVFSLILGWMIIGDKISGTELAAMVFLLVGSIVASLKKNSSSFKISMAFWLMMLSCVLYAAYGLVVRYLSASVAFPTIFFWVILFDAIAISSSFVSKKIRQDFVQTFRSNSIGFFLLFLVIVVIGNIGLLLNQWALSLKPGALVYSLEGFQVLFVFCLAIVVAKISPSFIAESTDKKNLLVKFLAFLIIMIGMVMLSF